MSHEKNRHGRQTVEQTPDEKMAGRKYLSDDELAEVVRRFEECSFAPDDFKHREHLAVALWYAAHLPDEAAAEDEMRAGLLRFLARHAVGEQVYHETITRFWMRRVRSLFLSLRSESAQLSLAEIANRVEEQCRDAKLIYRYYSRELLGGDEARAFRVEPDVQPLDF